MLHHERPLALYAAIALITGLTAVGLGVPVIEEYLRTGLVGRFPTAFLAASLVGEGVVFGGPRLVRVDQLGSDPGAFLFLAELLIGLVLPFALLRSGERLRGYLATGALALAAAVALGPLTDLIRRIADTF